MLNFKVETTVAQLRGAKACTNHAGAPSGAGGRFIRAFWFDVTLGYALHVDQKIAVEISSEELPGGFPCKVAQIEALNESILVQLSGDLCAELGYERTIAPQLRINQPFWVLVKPA